MAAQGEEKKDVYSVWGVPPEDVTARIKKLMEGLRSEFGGPQFEPHVTIVGAISLTESEARDKFRKACDGLKTYGATVLKVDTGTFFYQCVFLLLDPTTQVNYWFIIHFHFQVLVLLNPRNMLNFLRISS